MGSKSSKIPEGTPPVPDDAPPRTDSDAPPSYATDETAPTPKADAEDDDE